MRNLVWVLAVILLVVGLVAGYFAGKSSVGSQQQVTTTGGTVTTTITKTKTVTQTETKTVSAGGLQGTIKIGALLPLTGDLGSYGKRNAEAVKMAEADFNKFLEEIDANWRLKVIIEDTETSKDKALEKLQILAAQGVKAVVGPMASSEVSNVKNYADSNKIVIVSQSSTAMSLALPDDYIFRLCTPDKVQSRVLAKMIHDDGRKVLITIWRGDPWGDGLASTTKSIFKELGGIVDEGIRYPEDTADFSSFVESLANRVNSYLEQGYTTDDIAILLISFDEVQQIFQTASQYDILGEVKWYGTDGTALNSKIIEDPVAAAFAVKVKFSNTIYSAGFSEKAEMLRERLRAKLGETPDSYAITAYDAVWLIGLTIQFTQEYDGEVIKNMLPKVAEIYYGVTGWAKLDENGDRAQADYEIWEPVVSNGNYEWKLVGIYNSLSDSFNWLEEH